MLYDRIIKQGTINEPDGKPEPQFALPSTVNWMRALRILAEDEGIDFGTATDFYGKEGKRKMDARVENTVLEQLFLGLHHLSALDQFGGGTTAADYARVGVLAWYYGIANAASAMTAAQSGSFQEDHGGTARLWDEQIASRGLAMAPFSWRVSSLVEKTYKAEVNALRNGSAGKLQTRPFTKDDALGAAAGYLSGSAKWYSGAESEDWIGLYLRKPCQVLRAAAGVRGSQCTIRWAASREGVSARWAHPVSVRSCRNPDVGDGKPKIMGFLEELAKIGLQCDARHLRWTRMDTVLDTSGCQADLTWVVTTPFTPDSNDLGGHARGSLGKSG